MGSILKFSRVAAFVVGAEIEVVHEALLVATDVDKGGIEALHDFLHLAEEDIAHGELADGLLLVELHQPLVFQQRNLHAFVRG